jgi:hypothetical protein
VRSYARLDSPPRAAGRRAGHDGQSDAAPQAIIYPTGIGKAEVQDLHKNANGPGQGLRAGGRLWSIAVRGGTSSAFSGTQCCPKDRSVIR